jgi:putative sigma-54 modulation protein
MIEKLDITGVKYKVSDDLKRYTAKKIGRLDRFLPRRVRDDIVAKVVVTQVDKAHGNKYELTAALDIPGGKMITAKDEAGNVFAGIDILEAKLTSQIHRYKTETEMRPRGRRGLKNLFIKRV